MLRVKGNSGEDMKSKTFTLTEHTRQMIVDTIMHTAADGSMQVIIRPTKSKRSIAQNSLLHSWFREIADGYELSHGERHAPDIWKQYLKRLFLGQEAITVLGNKMVAMRQTSKLSVKEMTEFMEAVDRWAATELELQLSHPSDLWRDAMT